jgi:hypothetical protein
MPKDNSFSDHEMTLLPVEDKVDHFTLLQHFIEVCQATLECFAINGEIIHEHLHDFLNWVREYHHHAPLKLHSPNDIHLYAKVSYGHVKVVLLWSSRWIEI